MPKVRSQSQPTALVDTTIDAPEGASPVKLHILLDKTVVGYAEKYKNALMSARGIPQNQTAIPISDPVAVFYVQQRFPADAAIREAISTYQRWAYQADQEGWILALLYDNVFSGTPEPYEPDDNPPGIIVLEAPRNLNNLTEARLKLIRDFLNIDSTFDTRVMAAINDAIAKAILLVEADVAGFPAK